MRTIHPVGCRFVCQAKERVAGHEGSVVQLGTCARVAGHEGSVGQLGFCARVVGHEGSVGQLGSEGQEVVAVALTKKAIVINMVAKMIFFIIGLF